MGIQPIRSMRISSSMQTQMLLEQMRMNTLQMFNGQQQLATGRRLLIPSDDPSGAARAMDLGAILERQAQLQRNAGFADRFVSATDAALADVRNILNEANQVASQNVGLPANSEQRAAAAAVVDGLISQLTAIANRQHEGMYIFAGQAIDRPPFEEMMGGVIYKGDTQGLSVNIDGTGSQTISLTGEQVFGAISAEVRGWAPLMPRLDGTVRLSDLRGATGDGVRLGQIEIDEVGGAGRFAVDLASAHTIGDVAAAINAAAGAAGATVTASVTTTGLRLDVGGAFQLAVADPGQGVTASDLGIRQPAAPGPLLGTYLQPKVTLSTPVAWLRTGLGIDQANGLMLSNGDKTITVDLSGAQTVQDILNAINGNDMGVLARINEDGTGIDVLSRLSGSQLSIGENGGTTATDLGIRSLHANTKLASLNDGAGVHTVAGDDIRIVTLSGATVDVDIDGAQTIGDVIGRINAAATAGGVALTASLATAGNGIQLADATVGAGTLRAERLNFSQAMDDLGLDGSSSTNQLVSRDVSVVRPAGAFSVLADLRASLAASDTAGITRAGEHLAGLLQQVGGVQGQAGSLGKLVAAQQAQLGDAVLASKSLLSDVQDADYTEVITKFMQAQTVLQANLMTGSKLSQLSLLDFLK